ncbi:hypothetical protein HpMS107_18820 [Helicobacter pylori]
MGTITQRVRKDGSIWHTAQIRLKQGGTVMFTEAKTFDRRQATTFWLEEAGACAACERHLREHRL